MRLSSSRFVPLRCRRCAGACLQRGHFVHVPDNPVMCATVFGSVANIVEKQVQSGKMAESKQKWA